MICITSDAAREANVHGAQTTREPAHEHVV
jgi:hypothetical protein